MSQDEKLANIFENAEKALQLVENGIFEDNLIPEYEPSYLQQNEPMSMSSFMD